MARLELGGGGIRIRRMFTDKAEKAVMDDQENRREAYALLDLINAEFTTDPTSTQCFDLRIVERVRACVEKQKQIDKDLPYINL